MKTSSRQLFPALAAALLLGLAFARAADEPQQKTPDAAPPSNEKAAADNAAPAPAAPAQAQPASELRRVDTPAAADTAASPAETRAPREVQDVVSMGHDVSVEKDERAGDVVAVFGSARMEGESRDVVAVMGNVRVTGPAQDVVAVLGNVYVNGRTHDVVAVLGDVELGPQADVQGDLVSIGGVVTRDAKASVRHGVQNISFGVKFGHFDRLRAWFMECALWGRLLAFDRAVAWTWLVAAAFLAFYVLLALLFRGGIDRCTQTLATRPGSSILAAILTVLLAPIAIVLLCITLIGIPVVPFIAVGLGCATLFGKAVMLACIGRPVTRLFGNGPLAHPAVGVLIGGVLVTLLYAVPILGILVFKLLGWIGLGVVVYTLMLTTRREKPAAANASVFAAPGDATGATTAASTMPAQTIPPSTGVHAFAAPLGAMAGAETSAASVIAAPVVGVPPPLPTAVPAATLPRAGFWIRLWALFLDIILVAVLTSLIFETLEWFVALLSQLRAFPHALRLHGGPPSFLLMLGVYGALMWKFRGTTIGGIICGLKVVRIDNRPMDWATAAVRAVSCFLSLVVVGLGFIWVAIDEDKQSWHDRIAGTTVVRVPKGVSLV
ncbi:MAG TPA: RDD family protein [Opitutaceae bacterium]|nr:RDD family protein [Opitutaceae bacterium]